MTKSERELPRGPKVTCRECKTHVHYFLADATSRQGGGTYRRGGRFYRGHTCVGCVESALIHAMTRDGRLDTSRTSNRWSVSSLLRALTAFIYREVTDLDEGRWRARYHRDDLPFEEFWTALNASIADQRAENQQAAERARITIRAILAEEDDA
ncbi:hypothetical protein [Microbacterium sp. 77mftsu3.1]|uniref:hypothetical protein n=1 Tax=Microbacterium sp. 77mftsu3.1 TaxID=1761802 RepID=UPI00036CC939|nr:hypothetical protein [Microbacterium sp. 77mftsu3.1]SDH33130.1 hypothetical protein SAMN04488590_3047 [Microbacterium sp. 77mftsu3.1]